MKRTVIYTQRVEVVESYRERRDCTDQNIPLLLEACGYLPVPVPNVITDLDMFVETVSPAGIMLTGGNSLVKYGGTALERDETDRRLIGIALRRNIPLYGFAGGCSLSWTILAVRWRLSWDMWRCGILWTANGEAWR